ncbi:MAG: efflux RND transporter permease subunit [Pseudomonadota bacterium]
MDLTRAAIDRPLYVWLLIAACVGGGLWGIDTVGRLEDPPFPVKTAFVITSYPGASAQEVEDEVTEVVEAAIQELPQLDVLISKSIPGRSEIQVDLHERYGPADVPQIWDELRRRVSEAAQSLPASASVPLVEDDYGDIYGMLYAIRMAGYSHAEQRDVARTLTTALKGVPGVAKVTTLGLPAEAVYVEIPEQRLLTLGLPLGRIHQAIASESQVRSAGSLRHGERRLRIAPTTAFASLANLRELRLGPAGTIEGIALGELATIRRASVDVQLAHMRYQGDAAFALAISATEGNNVVDVGQAVAETLTELEGSLPIGVQLDVVYAQHDAVERAIETFLKNLLLSVATVFAALFLFMGWRAGVVVGSVLLLTVLGTLAIMALFGIELQRISLGALMIAMGMLVDNAIVIAEGMIVALSRPAKGNALESASGGRLRSRDAASEAVQRTRWPLLGATVIGILAFAPIGLSDDNSGYFLRSLFQVVCIALLLSWVLAITVVPVLGARLLQAPATAVDDAQRYGAWGYRPYRLLLDFGLRRAWLGTLAIVAVTLACFSVGQWLKVGFFPNNNTPLVFLDLRLSQGADLEATADTVALVEASVQRLPEVISVTSFIGRAGPRFMATQRPQQPNPAYAELIVEIQDVNDLPAVMARLKTTLASDFPALDALVRRTEFSPTGHYKLEARISGPDPSTLRRIGEQMLAVYRDQGMVDGSFSWRQRAFELEPRFAPDRARLAGIRRTDLAAALAFATDGIPAGTFRDRDQVLPILLRAPPAERATLEALVERRIYSPAEQSYVPLSQVIDGFVTRGEETMIWRRNRQRTLTAQANPPNGVNPTEAFNRVRTDIEAVPLPPGYRLEWGGEYEGSNDARRLLLNKVPITFGSMILITLLLFGSLRQAIVIWLTVPMCACGLILVLVAMDLSFTFPAFLGFLSLIGMLIKNCIVLVDEIDRRLEEHAPTLSTVATASVSRLRPVALAAGTTIAGMAPLLTDAFFREMAVGIMGGLAFATLITLFAVPVFYRIALGRRLR